MERNAINDDDLTVGGQDLDVVRRTANHSARSPPSNASGATRGTRPSYLRVCLGEELTAVKMLWVVFGN